MEAFWELTTERPYIGHQGIPGPIPWTAIERYGLNLQMCGEDLDDFHHMLRSLDDELLENARSKESSGKPGTVHKPDGSAR